MCSGDVGEVDYNNETVNIFNEGGHGEKKEKAGQGNQLSVFGRYNMDVRRTW
jgi:hypothetical protein